MSAPHIQPGHHLAAPGRSAVQAYRWPQVKRHPAAAAELKRAPGPWVGWTRHCQRFQCGPRRLCMASDLTQLAERAS